jgi:hypothetical protein
MQSSEGTARVEEALENLSIPCHLLPGDHPYVTAEIANINTWLNQEHKATTGTAWLSLSGRCRPARPTSTTCSTVLCQSIWDSRAMQLS